MYLCLLFGHLRLSWFWSIQERKQAYMVMPSSFRQLNQHHPFTSCAWRIKSFRWKASDENEYLSTAKGMSSDCVARIQVHICMIAIAIWSIWIMVWMERMDSGSQHSVESSASVEKKLRMLRKPACLDKFKLKIYLLTFGQSKRKHVYFSLTQSCKISYGWNLALNVHNRWFGIATTQVHHGNHEEESC